MRLKVLIVEDDPIQGDSLAYLLGLHGYYPEVASDGRDAVRRICNGMFHVALLDYRLPEIDGLGVARVIRNLRAPSNRPRLVALTSAPQDLVAHLLEFDEIISKPIDPALLLPAIERGRPAGALIRQAALRGLGEPDPCVVPVATGPALPRDSAGARGRVLLVDDDAQMLEFMRLTLLSCGFKVDVAQDGLEAVGRIGDEAYDVVVLDFNMPKLDGLAAAKVIYDLTERRICPSLIALTSAPDRLAAQDQRWHLVFDEIVSKASGVQAILLAVENCLKYRVIRSKKALDTLNLQSLIAFAGRLDDVRSVANAPCRADSPPTGLA